VFRYACKLGFEGIVSKRLSAPYRSGPSRDWHRNGAWWHFPMLPPPVPVGSSADLKVGQFAIRSVWISH
jgi:hypothetical protein